MKRDMELVRAILLALEDGHPKGAPLKLGGFSDEQIHYHLAIMKEAGLIEAAVSREIGAQIPFAVPLAITWSGHEFIDNARNATVWNQAKGVMDRAGGFSLEVMKGILVKLAADGASKFMQGG